MDIVNGLVGAAMLFTVNVVEGVQLKIDFDCPNHQLQYNQTTQVFSCGRLTLEAAACKPTSVTNVETGNANIVCTESGPFRLSCPGGFRQVASERGAPVTYFCDDVDLPAPSRIRIIAK